MEFQWSYFKSLKTMLWKCCTQYSSKFGKLSSGHRTGKGQFSFQSLRKAMPKNAQTTAQLHSSHTLVGEGNGTPLQYSCLENPRDGEAWWAAVCGVAQSQTRLKWLSSSSSSSSSSRRLLFIITLFSPHLSHNLYMWKVRVSCSLLTVPNILCNSDRVLDILFLI